MPKEDLKSILQNYSPVFIDGGDFPSLMKTEFYYRRVNMKWAFGFDNKPDPSE